MGNVWSYGFGIVWIRWGKPMEHRKMNGFEKSPCLISWCHLEGIPFSDTPIESGTNRGFHPGCSFIHQKSHVDHRNRLNSCGFRPISSDPSAWTTIIAPVLTSSACRPRFSRNPYMKKIHYIVVASLNPNHNCVVYGILHTILIGGSEHFSFFHLLGISYSQLINISQRGRLNDQPAYIICSVLFLPIIRSEFLTTIAC